MLIGVTCSVNDVFEPLQLNCSRNSTKLRALSTDQNEAILFNMIIILAALAGFNKF